MREISIIIKGNYRKNKSAFIGITILMLIVSMSLTTVLSTIINTATYDKKAIEETGYGDIVSAIDYQKDQTVEEYLAFCDELAKNMEKCDGVEKVEQVPISFMNIENLNGKSGSSSAFIIDYESEYLKYNIYDANNNLIQDPHLNKGEISVPISFVSLYDCKLGDVITLKSGEDSYELKVVSFFEDPFMGSSLMGIKTLLVSSEDIAMFEASEWKGNKAILLNVFKDKSSSMNDVKFEAMLNKETSYSGYAVVSLSKTQAINYMTLLTNIFSGILVGFIIMLMVATLIVLNHNISSSIEHDFVNIGILKSVGMSNKRIKQSIILGYMCFLLIGAVIGFFLSFFLIKILNEITKTSTGLYLNNIPAMLESILAILAIFVILFLFIVFKMRKVTAISPIMAINGRSKDIHFSSIFKLPISKKLLGISLAYRQFISGKKQYIGIMFITSILVMFMIMIGDMCMWFGDGGKNLADTFNVVSIDLQVKVKDEAVLEDIDKIVNEYSEAERFIMGSRYVLFENTQIWCGICSRPDLFESVYKGRTCTYDNEILITEFVTKNYGIKIGDTVNISIDGKTVEYIVSGYYQCMNDSGKNIAMSLEGYKRLEDISTNTYCYDLADDETIKDVETAIKNKYSEDKVEVSVYDPFDGLEVVIIAVYGMAVLIYLISGVFIAITVVLICTKIFAKEKKDYGIYKAMGFTSSQLRVQFATRFMLASFWGSGLGTVLTLIFSNDILGAIFSITGLYNFESSLNVIAIIIPILFMMLLYFIFAFIVSRKMKKVTPRILITE